MVQLTISPSKNEAICLYRHVVVLNISIVPWISNAVSMEKQADMWRVRRCAVLKVVDVWVYQSKGVYKVVGK